MEGLFLLTNLVAVPRMHVDVLHTILKSIDKNYNEGISLQSQLKLIPSLKSFFEDHVVVMPYSFNFQKCRLESFEMCKPFRSPQVVRNLVLQRQPTPTPDPSRGGKHFLHRNDAIANFVAAGYPAKALEDVTHLPSQALEDVPLLSPQPSNEDKLRIEGISK
jgi:hypothetical protein